MFAEEGEGVECGHGVAGQVGKEMVKRMFDLWDYLERFVGFWA